MTILHIKTPTLYCTFVYAEATTGKLLEIFLENRIITKQQSQLPIYHQI